MPRKWSGGRWFRLRTSPRHSETGFRISSSAGGHSMEIGYRFTAVDFPPQRAPDHPRQQGEVVVLNQYDGIGGLRLLDGGIGEFAVHLDVLFPIGGTEGRADVGDVAQGPKPLVGEPEVVARLLLVREPNPADAVGRLARGNRDAGVGGPPPA